MIIRNTSDGLASVSINTSDSIPDTTPTPSFGYQSGWRYVPSITEEMKLTSDVMGSSSRIGGKSASAMESSPPFIWSGLSSTKIQIQPLSTTEIELQISAFSPGVYNLSSYTLNWELSHHENASSSSSSSRSSGTCEGYPHYLTVLQSQ